MLSSCRKLQHKIPKSEQPISSRIDAPGDRITPPLLLRAGFGGGLAGLANLVPGISGGTMLLATGVYPAVVDALAGLVAGRPRRRDLLLLGAISLTAFSAIVLLAGPTRMLVQRADWAAYCLFIGLSLGGAPALLRLAQPVAPAFRAGAALGFALVCVSLLWPAPGGAGGGDAVWLRFLAGASAGVAMLLPGISGGYLLLIFGQYLPVLGAIDGLKQAAFGAAPGAPEAHISEHLAVLAPVALGAVLGVAALSRLLHYALSAQRQPTLGVLLGLLLGAVVGLWPFESGAAFLESAGAASLLIAVGALLTLLIDRLAGGREGRAGRRAPGGAGGDEQENRGG